MHAATRAAARRGVDVVVARATPRTSTARASRAGGRAPRGLRWRTFLSNPSRCGERDMPARLGTIDDEAQVPAYTLPELLDEGTATPEDW